MRADNEGEGGIMALIALDPARARAAAAAAKVALVALGVFGASLFYGDGMITPAISVLSAVEGLEGRRAGARVDRHARSRSTILTVLFVDPALRHRRGRPRCSGR